MTRDDGDARPRLRFALRYTAPRAAQVVLVGVVVGSGRQVAGVAGALAALALLVGAGALAYRGTSELVAAQARIARAREVLATMDAAMTSLKDGEIAIRDYLVSGDDDLAERPVLVRPALMEGLTHLGALVGDDAEQRATVDALDGAVRAQLAYAEDLVRRRAERMLAGPELTDRLVEDRRRLDEVEGIAAEIRSVAEKRVAAREDAGRTATRRALRALGGGTIVAVALLATALALLQRTITQRRRVETDLRVIEGRLTLALGETDAAQLLARNSNDARTDENRRVLVVVRANIRRMAELIASLPSRARRERTGRTRTATDQLS